MSEAAAAEGGGMLDGIADGQVAEGEGKPTGEGEGEGKPTGEGEGEGAAAAAGEGEGEGAKAGEGEGEGEAKPTAPEKYEAFNPPEGVENLDPLLVDAISPVFQEHGLSQEQAQGMVEGYYKVQEAEVAAFEQRKQDENESLRATLGKEFEPTQARITNLYKTYSEAVGAESAAKLGEVIAMYGLHSNGALVSFLDFAAKGLSMEDSVAGTGGGPKDGKATGKSPEQELYGSMYNEDGTQKNP